MMKTNLTPSPRLIGHGVCCCLKDLLYNKATLILMIFMLPLVGVAQERQAPASQKEKMAEYQEYLQKINGNKTELQNDLNVQEIEISAEAKMQQHKNIKNQEIRAKLLDAGVDPQKYLDNGYTLQQILDELDTPRVSDSKGNDSNVLYREDLCANAPILYCDTPDTGSTVGASSTGYLAGCGGGFTNGEGVWYSFTGNNANNTIAITSSSFSAQVRVYSGSCGALQCAGGAAGQSTTSVTLFAAFGDTYYVYISGFANTEGTYTVERTSTAPCNDTPPGDGLAPATAFPIACGDIESGDTTGFPASNTTQAGCGPAANPSPAVWYTFTAVAGTPEEITLTTCGYDTRLAVWSGSPGNLVCVGGNDDATTSFCPTNSFESEFSFVADIDVTYYVKVWAWSSFNTGSAYDLRMVCDGDTVTPPPSAPNNDLCPDATELICNTTIDGTNIAATDTDEPGFFCGTGINNVGVWYFYDGDGDDVIVNTCGFDTKMNVYTGSCGALTCVGGNDDTSVSGCSTFGESQVAFTANAGQRYYIYVSSFSSTFEGDFQITLTCPEPLENDDCDGALDLLCGDSITGSTVTASNSAPPFCDYSFSSPGVWYRHVGTGELLTIDLSGSDYDTKIALYTGDCDSGLVCVEGDDDGGTGVDSRLDVATIAGQEYFLYVGGFSSSSAGTYIINVTCQPDPCEEADTIACGDTVTGTTTGGSTAGPTAFCGTSPGATGIFYRYEGTDEFVTASLCNSGYDTKINVYQGDCGALTCVGGNDDFCGSRSEFQWFAGVGETYYIWVSGFSTATGNYELSLTCDQPEANDLCDDALALSCDTTVSGSTVLSTERGSPVESCQGITPNAGVWYTISGTGGDIEVSTCGAGTNFDTMLVIYSGACDALECIDSNDDSCGSRSEVTFASNAGETYYVYVTGFGSSRGNFDLSIDCLCAPGNAGTECVTIYDGYDPASSTTLTAEMLYADGAVSYAWSNGDTNQTTTVNAADGTQNYSVTMTDSTGCTVTQEYFVYVIDVNCDTRGTDKVEVCHNGTTICVAPSAIEAHLQHGDVLGACGSELCDELTPFCDSVATAPADGAVDVSTLPTISWNSATGIIDGYTLTVGTSSGASDVLSLDVGNATSYSFDTELDYLTTYYVSVVPYNGNGAASIGCAETSFTTQEDPLPNDDCDGAVALTVNPNGSCAVTYIADHTDGTDSNAGIPCDGFDDIDSWYTFVAPANGAVRLSTTNITQSSTPGWSIYTSCGGSNVFCVNNTGTPQVVTGLTPGQTYTLNVWYDGFASEGIFEICLQEGPAPLTNDTCATALGLTVNSIGNDCAVTETIDMSSASASGALFSCDTFGTNTDAWFTFVAPASGDVDMTVTDISQSGTPEHALFDACSGNEIACGTGNTGNSFTGLTPGQTYTLAIWYDTSGNGEFEICLNEPDPSAYCDAIFTNTSDEWISGFELNTINNASGSEGYANFTAISTDLIAGSSYNFTISVGYGGFAFNEQYAIWIDFNQDADFDDAGEQVFLSASTNATTVNGSLTVPASALSGPTRLRVIQDFGGIVGPCVNTSFGEAEDYTVNIVNGARPAADTKGATNEVIGWTMSPNPTKGNVNLDLTNYLRSDVSIQVVDFTGKLISTRQLDNLQTSRYTLELSNSLPAGMYFVQVSNANSTSAKKLVIMR